MRSNLNKLIIAGLIALVFAGCAGEPKDHKAEIARMEDTLFKAFPTVNRVSVEVKDDMGTEVHITLGDVSLYNAAEEERKTAVLKASAITSHIFSKDKPGKGSVVFVKEENTIVSDESSKKTYEMSLAPEVSR